MSETDQNSRGRDIAIAHLRRDITHPDAPRFLLEHLAEWGAEGINVQDMAQRALTAEAEE